MPSQIRTLSVLIFISSSLSSLQFFFKHPVFILSHSFSTQSVLKYKWCTAVANVFRKFTLSAALILVSNNCHHWRENVLTEKMSVELAFVLSDNQGWIRSNNLQIETFLLIGCSFNITDSVISRRPAPNSCKHHHFLLCGTFPSTFSCETSLDKTFLYPNNLKNLSPVFNLSFLLKVQQLLAYAKHSLICPVCLPPSPQQWSSPSQSNKWHPACIWLWQCFSSNKHSWISWLHWTQLNTLC